MPAILDSAVPALVLTMGYNPMQHGALGAIRSLGRLGVCVYAVVIDRFAPPALSRYLTRSFVWNTYGAGDEQILGDLLAIGKRLGRPTILVPTDDRAAVFVVEHSAVLEEWFVFPRPPRDLPRRLADKRELYRFTRDAGLPCPKAVFPGSLDDVYEFIEGATFPIVVKAATPQRLPNGVASTSIARNPKDLLAIYRRTETPESPNLIFQEYLPASCAEDWIYHGYRNPQTRCSLAFTGRKLRSYPPFAGPTALGISVANEKLCRHADKLLTAIGYAGIMDLDYRFDRRDGQYKLLDFNPRIGANFRMFENSAGIDVVRALYLDLTGRTVPSGPMVKARKFVVESYDVAASIGYMRYGGLTVRGWWRSLRGTREPAWFCGDDPLPALAMCFRLLFRVTGRAVCSGLGIRPRQSDLLPRVRVRKLFFGFLQRQKPSSADVAPAAEPRQ